MCPLFPFRAFCSSYTRVETFRILNAISPFLTCFPYHRSPSACLEGTHGDRVAGDNTQHSHRLLSFSFYVTRSRTKRIQTRPLTCTIRQARRSLSRRLAARVPSLKLHIPCISTLRINQKSPQLHKVQSRCAVGTIMA